MNLPVWPAFTIFSLLYLLIFSPAFFLVSVLLGFDPDVEQTSWSVVIPTVMAFPSSPTYVIFVTLFTALVSALVAAIAAANNSSWAILVIMVLMLLTGLLAITAIQADLKLADAAKVALWVGSNDDATVRQFFTDLARIAAAQLGVLLGVSGIKSQSRRGD